MNGDTTARDFPVTTTTAHTYSRYVTPGDSFISRISVFVAFALATSLVSYHLGADINWDLLNYHFNNGYLYTHGKLFRDSLGTIQSYLDPLLNSFYYLLISTLPPLWVNIILAILQSIALSSVFFLSRFMLGSGTVRYPVIGSAIIAISALFGPAFWSEIGGTMGDTLLATPVIVALLLTVRYMTMVAAGAQRLSYVTLAGLLLGLASGLKFTNMVYALAMFLSLALVLSLTGHIQRRTTLFAILAFGTAASVGFCLIYGRIAWLLWEHYRNPIFPYFNNIFRSLYLGGYAIHDSRWIPTTLYAYVGIPFNYLVRHTGHGIGRPGGMEILFRTCFFAIISVLIIPYIWLQRRARRTEASPDQIGRTFFLTFFFIAFIIWAHMFGYYRYLAVLEIIAPLALFIMLEDLIPSRYAMRSVGPSAIVFLAALFSFPHYTWGREPFRASYFGISKVPLDPYRNSLLIIGHAPMGFIIPYFPSTVRTIGIPERIGRPTKEFQKSYLAPLHTFRGPIYYLTSYPQLSKNSGIFDVLARYGLHISRRCAKITTSIYPIAICRVRRARHPTNEP
ncbi:MAG: hypothetical protein M0Z76_10755 [Gammaproteobacteria bacterium]|nr:hypothetical protein [Gammaproteobacteria bacterium]